MLVALVRIFLAISDETKSMRVCSLFQEVSISIFVLLITILKLERESIQYLVVILFSIAIIFEFVLLVASVVTDAFTTVISWKKGKEMKNKKKKIGKIEKRTKIIGWKMEVELDPESRIMQKINLAESQHSKKGENKRIKTNLGVNQMRAQRNLKSTKNEADTKKSDNKDVSIDYHVKKDAKIQEKGPKVKNKSNLFIKQKFNPKRLVQEAGIEKMMKEVKDNENPKIKSKKQPVDEWILDLGEE